MKVEEQLFKENNNQKYTHFCEVLDVPLIKQTISKLDGNSMIKEITTLAYSIFGNDSENILDLSFESGATVLASIKDILEFDSDKIIKAKKGIKSSIAKSARIRKLLDECTIDSVQVYMQRKNALLQAKNEFLTKQIELSELVQEKEFIKLETETTLEKAQLLLTEELKKESISDISSRAILMLDNLQSVLYHKQIEKIENTFRKEINLLMRKTKFIDDIKIDDSFNIHIYRHEKFTPQQLIKIISTNQEGNIEDFTTSEAYKKLQLITGQSDYASIIEFLKCDCKNDILLPVEIEKTSLSNGEKQIFIMALYHSLVKLCNREVPFVIDTPFARIDTEHRQNISKHGQQRIVSLNMLVNYIKFNYGTEIDDIRELVEIRLNCFDKFKEFQEHKYTLSNVDDKSLCKKIIESDKLRQIELLEELYEFIHTSKILDTVDKARKFLTKLGSCQVNVIVADEENSKTSTEYYIDVNLKGIKLDREDIFKGYLFSQDSTKEIRNAWVSLKQEWIHFNETLSGFNADKIYPLTKILEHYIYCDILNKAEYLGIRMDEDFLLTEPCDIKGTHYYKGEHIIKVVNNNTFMRNIIKDTTNYISCLNAIIEDDGGVPTIMKKYLKNVDSKERKIICNIIKKSILDKVLIVPKMLILKYYIAISREDATRSICKEIYAVYFYTVLFMLFGDKKNDAEMIKKISSSNKYYSLLISTIKQFLSDKKLAATRFIAIARWNSNFENEELQYKCKSLATIYNYFKLENERVSISSVDEVESFLVDDNKFSIEHLIVNKSGKVKYLDDKEAYPLPENTRQYNSYIFNFIFVPKEINKNILKDYSLEKKMKLLNKKDNMEQIECEYSKMVVSVLDSMFKQTPEIKQLDEQETEELDKYWLVTFKREYSKYAATIVDKLIERFQKNLK